MAEYIYGGKGVLFWITQLATFAILILAANTAYADFPRPVVDHRPRRLPAPPARQPRRQARVLQRHHLPRRRRRRPDRRLQGQHLGAHPAVRVRRVHRVHAEPGRDGASTTSATGGALAGVAGDQRRRCVATGDRGARRRGLQVHRGGVDPGRADPGAGGRRSAPIDQHYARVRDAVQVDDRLHARRGAPTSSSCSSARVHRGRDRGRAVRPVAGPGAPDRGLGRHRRRGAGAASSTAWDRLRRCRSSCTRSRRRTAS